MKKNRYFLTTRNSEKRILFLIFAFLSLFITINFLRFFYESCFVLYRKAKRIYTPQKRFMPVILDTDITKIKQRITMKVEEKKQYEKILHGKSKLFNFYQKIRKFFGKKNTLLHSTISSKTISITAESQNQEDIDELLEQLQNETCFSSVRIRSLEKTTNNTYLYTIAIEPKRIKKTIKK